MNGVRIRAALVMVALAAGTVVAVKVAMDRDLQTHADYSVICPKGTVQVVVKPLPRENEIKLKLYNGTGREGAAITTAETLRHHGIKVAPVNAGDKRKPTDAVAQIYFGPKAFGAAWVMRAYFSMTTKESAGWMHFDPNEKSDVVTVVLGTRFRQLGGPTDMREAMAVLSQPTAPPGTCGVTAG
jgi:hypothetical protein